MARSKFTHRVSLSDSAASVIETDVIDAYDPERSYESEDMAPIRAAWRPGVKPSLVFTSAEAELLAAALCELSNRADDLSREPGADEDERQIYRRASGGLATAMMNVRRAV